MLEYLFGNQNVEKILIYLLLHEKTYATELSKCFNSSLDPIQKTLKKLEEGGLLISFLEGKTRLFLWNPRYPFLNELKALAQKAYQFLPPEIQKTYQPDKRKSPRKTGKPPMKIDFSKTPDCALAEIENWSKLEKCPQKFKEFRKKLLKKENF